jgi:hypothetical protein
MANLSRWCHSLARSRTSVVLISLLVIATGCFQGPSPDRPLPVDGALLQRVKGPLAGRRDDALAYAALYAVLAERFESGAYATTSEAADVAARAAEIIRLPGVLKEVVNDELNPVIGKPQPITPERAAQAAATLRALSTACREAAQ